MITFLWVFLFIFMNDEHERWKSQHGFFESMQQLAAETEQKPWSVGSNSSILPTSHSPILQNKR